MEILANTFNRLKKERKRRASERGSHIIKSKLLIHFNSFKKNLWFLQRRGRGEETPRQTSDLFELGSAKPHSPEAKQVVSGLPEDNRRLSTGENGAESCQRTAWPELPSRSPRRRSRSAAVALRRPGPGFPEAERGAGGGQERSKAARPSPPAAPPWRPPRIVRGHPRPPRRLLRSTGSPGAPLPGPGHLGGGKGEGESPDHACDVLRDRPQPRVRGRHEAGGGARGGPGPGEATRACCWRKSAKIHVSRPLRQLPAAPDTAALKPARRSPRSPSVTVLSIAGRWHNFLTFRERNPRWEQ